MRHPEVGIGLDIARRQIEGLAEGGPGRLVAPGGHIDGAEIIVDDRKELAEGQGVGQLALEQIVVSLIVEKAVLDLRRLVRLTGLLGCDRLLALFDKGLEIHL